ncbi:MAG: preprotein translocase subunit SecG [Clostridiales bacterium]|mgnify:FL=1|jgi:preprotein translocase secG subunit|nr:preprotein translocase subunit SecG [Clostridiales bacterium]
MEILKIILVVIFNITAFLLMVLCFTQTKQETGVSAAVMSTGRDSFYEKNKNRTREGRMDNIIRGLFILLVLLAVGLYFV